MQQTFIGIALCHHLLHLCVWFYRAVLAEAQEYKAVKGLLYGIVQLFIIQLTVMLGYVCSEVFAPFVQALHETLIQGISSTFGSATLHEFIKAPFGHRLVREGIVDKIKLRYVILEINVLEPRYSSAIVYAWHPCTIINDEIFKIGQNRNRYLSTAAIPTELVAESLCTLILTDGFFASR